MTLHPIVTVPNMTLEMLEGLLVYILVGGLVYFIFGISVTIFKKGNVEEEKL
ncbi:hypothetical protein [Bacillus pseudomycoides]|uniref:hypothetical protein n=1 Tax=Bacillus pseudomycoides TaxID=64104 RepID=UPI0015CF1EFF|nr:hypothetical protein [Bacillus pseudomycoides]